jgi:aldehyde dehydrogenase (NAD+)
MKIAREEIFGPVLVVIPYDGEDEAVAHRQRFGLRPVRLGVDRRRRARRRDRQPVRTGCVAINTGLILDFNAPFGGFKKSGIGRELGPEGIVPYTEYQSIIFKP